MENINVFNDFTDEYEQWFRDNEKIFQSELDAIKSVLPDSGKGVEIGVGSGLFSSNLDIKNGIEPSENMALKAEERGIEVVRACAESIPLEDESFDFALMVTVDCFVENLAKALSEAHRIIKNSGVLIIAFIDKDTPLGKIYEKNKKDSRFYKGANFNSASKIEAILKKTGFNIKRKKQTVYSFENIVHPVKNGTGQGVFAVIEAEKV